MRYHLLFRSCQYQPEKTIVRDITAIKKEFRNTGSPDALKLLLQRSVKMGHKRLALLRCLQAEKMGIAVDAATAAYCQKIADSLPLGELEQLLGRCK